jgi:hypothetical protein
MCIEVFIELAGFTEVEGILQNFPYTPLKKDGPGIESRWGRDFRHVQTGPGAHPASCKMGTGSFPGVKRPGRGVDHPPKSSAEVKERVELYLYSPSAPSWPVLGRTLPLPYLKKV